MTGKSLKSETGRSKYQPLGIRFGSRWRAQLARLTPALRYTVEVVRALCGSRVEEKAVVILGLLSKEISNEPWKLLKKFRYFSLLHVLFKLTLYFLYDKICNLQKVFSIYMTLNI